LGTVFSFQFSRLVPNKAAITIKEATSVETDCRAEQGAKAKNILGTKMAVLNER